jgi:chromatin segregation and condensation protein Rec8/ScpA/Scc1 (kleisin family)
MELPPEVVPRVITLAERAAVIREAIGRAGANPIVLQELLQGVRDRVVMAVTFLAMLELMKRRELVVTQDAPWGPIVARATTPAERGGTDLRDEPLDERLESFS